MELIELHILQSFPVTCLNRDDVGAPKTALFGGVRRARVSSQSWKRAIRELAKELNPSFFAGKRTRMILPNLKSALMRNGIDELRSENAAKVIADKIGTIDDERTGAVKTLVYFSPSELEAIVRSFLELGAADLIPTEMEAVSEDILDEKEMKKRGKKKAKKSDNSDLDVIAVKAVKSMKAVVKDAADIALFGRMVADDHNLTLEGAGLFSHALSTHSVANEIDFFSAVDDSPENREESGAGAGHIGTLEFNSACYYRYVGLNLGLLNDVDHFGGGRFTDEEKQAVLKAFLSASILAVPKARKNSMFGHTPPSYVLGLRRTGQPLSLVNAFESPVTAHNGSGFVGNSIEALKKGWVRLKSSYAFHAAQTSLPNVGIDALIANLLNNNPDRKTVDEFVKLSETNAAGQE